MVLVPDLKLPSEGYGPSEIQTYEPS